MPRGSAPGERRGGRQKGTPNKRTQEIQEAAASKGIMPLDYMLSVMRDKKVDFARRDDMAKSAAPYLHAKLAASTIEHTGKDGESLIPKSEPRQLARAILAILGEGVKETSDA